MMTIVMMVIIIMIIMKTMMDSDNKKVKMYIQYDIFRIRNTNFVRTHISNTRFVQQ